MCYHIAFEWDSPENKWRWIKVGLDFAEKGAVRNPTNGDLLFEIGYIYFHQFDSESLNMPITTENVLKRRQARIVTGSRFTGGKSL